MIVRGGRWFLAFKFKYYIISICNYSSHIYEVLITSKLQTRGSYFPQMKGKTPQMKCKYPHHLITTANLGPLVVDAQPTSAPTFSACDVALYSTARTCPLPPSTPTAPTCTKVSGSCRCSAQPDLLDKARIRKLQCACTFGSPQPDPREARIGKLQVHQGLAGRDSRIHGDARIGKPLVHQGLGP